MTSMGTPAERARSTVTPSSIWRRAAPLSAPMRCWTRTTSAIVRSGFWRWIWSAAPAQPRAPAGTAAARGAPRATASSGRMGSGSAGLSSTRPATSRRSASLMRQQAAHAVADDDRRPAQRVVPGDGIVDVAVEVELLEVGRVGPEVRPQVEGVPLPAALREVLEVALPDPRAAQLAVEQVQRPATRASLGQPALDVQARAPR